MKDKDRLDQHLVRGPRSTCSSPPPASENRSPTAHFAGARPAALHCFLLGSSIIEIEVVDRVTAVAAADWDRLAGEDDPFLEHAFLAALEASGSVGEERGLRAAAVLARDGRATARRGAALPQDQQLRRVHLRLGLGRRRPPLRIRYYPKLVAAIPFTPATGTAADAPRADVDRGDGRAGPRPREVAAKERASWCTSFSAPRPRRSGPGAALFPRLSIQFHWDNRVGRLRELRRFSVLPIAKP